ncbi:MAG: tyrosine-protein phosphatase [Geodermatophilaceae bacterium]|nr:tyrosine-protein phosphatase [Geodermatophilaceae bacterium]
MSHGRWISLRGAVNARDVGGLPTKDGATLAPGRLLRSDNLQDLTAEDIASLVTERDLRLVIDLRTEFEVDKEGPTPLQRTTDIAHRHLSLLPEAGQATDFAVEDLLPWQRDRSRSRLEGLSGPQLVAEVYRGYLRDRPDNIVAALRGVSGLTAGAALVHCAAGKDRTGVVVALALTVAGVPRESVVADYEATGEVIDALVARLVASPTYAADLAGRPVDSHRPIAEAMRLLLTSLDDSHGGPGGWLTSVGFGLAEQAALRARLVA